MFRFVLILNLILSYSFSAGSVFNYGTNAKEVSLSGATISMQNAGFNSFNNPAFISHTKAVEYGMSYFKMSLDRSIHSFSYSRKISNDAGIGLSFFMASVDDIVQTDLDNNSFGNLDYWEGFGAMSFSIKSNNLSSGITLKVYQSNLHNYKADAIGADIGFNYKVNEKSNVAFCYKNIGAKYNWDFNYDEDIENVLSAGYNYKHNNNLNFLFQFDNIGEYNKSKIGIEYSPLKNLKLRGGWKYSSNYGQVEDTSNLYYLGFSYSFIIFQESFLTLDYALDPGLMDEGMSHLFSFSTKINP